MMIMLMAMLIVKTAISADLEILRHRLGQAVGLGVGMSSINLAPGLPDLTLAKDDSGVDVEANRQRSGTAYFPAAETAKALAGADMFGPLYKHTSTDQWTLRWFVLKNFVIYVFKRKPEPCDQYVLPCSLSCSFVQVVSYMPNVPPAHGMWL
jgi:hypothetical protein